MSEFPSPIVSVVIPNYNYAAYLKSRIDSVLYQTFQDFEIIILDDCSTDNSRAVIEEYRNHPKVTRIEINEINSGGPFGQWEKGLALARGKYVWIAEADDLAHPYFLSTTVTALEECPTASFAMTMSNLIDSDGHPSDHKSFDNGKHDGSFHLYNGMNFLAQRIRVMNPCYNASQALIRRDAWLRMPDKFYTTFRYGGDWIFWIEMLRLGDVVDIHARLNSWRIHGASTTQRSKFNFKGVREMLMVFSHLMKIRKLLPDDTVRVLKYRYYRNYLRDKENLSPEQCKELLEEFFIPAGITPASYRMLLIYKHTVSPVLRFFGAGAKRIRPIKLMKNFCRLSH